jgi:hypothetical protein
MAADDAPGFEDHAADEPAEALDGEVQDAPAAAEYAEVEIVEVEAELPGAAFMAGAQPEAAPGYAEDEEPAAQAEPEPEVQSLLARLRSVVREAVMDRPAAPAAEAPRLVRARVIKRKKTDAGPESGIASLDSELPAALMDEAGADMAATEPAAMAEPSDDLAPPADALPEAPAASLLEDAADLDEDEPVDNLFGEPAAAAVAAALPPSSLSDEEEADLMRELAEVEREAEDQRPARAGKAVFEKHRSAEASVTRILRETESQLDDTEASRRRSTIAHLKAAVAATRADRDRGTDEDEGDDDLDRYRDDLDRVVRPRRPADGRGASAPRRLAPLMLVSEQRVDLPVSADANGDAVRPRRITTGNLALKQDDLDEDDGGLFGDSTSFTDYVVRMGATELPDLLEAAAAYAAYVEGRPHFSRPQLMEQVASFGDGSFSREDGLRSFGTLLRQGKIQRLKRGQFTIAKSSRFRPESFHA